MMKQINTSVNLDGIKTPIFPVGLINLGLLHTIKLG